MTDLLERRAVRPAAERMVALQLRARGLGDDRVLAAMSALPRHMFIPVPVRSQAYEDHAVPIGFDVTISQPFVVGWMSEALALDGSERVLEVGTGSGYQAAVLGMLARDVFTVERIPVLARRARWTLRALGVDNVHVFVGDGSLGLPEHGPYDAIVVAAAAPSMPGSLYEEVRVRGRLVVPVGGPAGQRLEVIVRSPEGPAVSKSVPCRFVPLVGAEGF